MSQKKFSEQKQVHLGMDLSEPAKQDGNDNTILLYHPYRLCHFANYALCLLCSSEGTRCMGVVKVLLGHFYLGFLRVPATVMNFFCSGNSLLVTCSFTSRECERHSYMPALYSGPYHVKKQSLQLFGINHLLFSCNWQGCTFLLTSHYRKSSDQL